MAFRSSVSTIFFGATALNATAPAGVQAGDRLIALMSVDLTGATFSAATGWSQLGQVQVGTPDGGAYAVFEKVTATGSDAYNFTVSGNSADTIVSVLCFSGRSSGAATIQATSNTTANASPVSVALTGVTAATGDDIAWLACMDATAIGAAYTYGTLTNYTKREESSAGWTNQGAFTRDNVSSGATGTLTVSATGGATAGFNGWVVALPAKSTRQFQSGTNIWNIFHNAR